jgi:3-hydroxypropanoate dehydrogenase
LSRILGQLFDQAHTFSYWQARPVPEGLVEAAFQLASLGPASANCEPLRLVRVCSPQAKEQLLFCVSTGNYEKVRTAPITAIVAYEGEFFEMLPRLYPHTDARDGLPRKSGDRLRPRLAAPRL